MSSKRISASIKQSTKSQRKGRRKSMATTTGTTGAVTPKNQVSGRFAWVRWMVGSVVWDAIASVILTWFPAVGPVVKLLIYTPTGASFLWAVENGLGVGTAYILFGLLVTVANGIAGILFLGQIPQNPLLAIAGSVLGILAILLSSKIRASEDSKPNATALGVVGLAVLVAWASMKMVADGSITGALFAAVATGLWDISATPISQFLESVFQAKNSNARKLVIRFASFIPTSFMYALVLEQSKGLLDTAIMVGVTSAALAPIMEALIYGGRKSKDYITLPLVVMLGAGAVWLMKMAF